MGTKDDKKPLVALAAANPEKPINMDDLAKSDSQASAGWAGSQSATQSPNTGQAQKDDGTPTLNEQQLKNIQNAPDGVSVNDVNKVPGKTEPKPNQGTVNTGVLAGAPSQVVIQHMLDHLPPMETKEEREKREKRERRNALFAAIGDGVSALSNLYFTTKGALNVDQSNTMAKAHREKVEKDRAERESNMERRMRLLKELWADRHRLEELKIKQGLAEAEKAAKEAKTANDVKRAEDLMKYYTKRNQILEEEKKAEAKRKAEKDKNDKERQDEEAANRNKNRDRTASAQESKAASFRSSVANQNYNRTRNTTSQINSRNSATETEVVNYDKKGNEIGRQKKVTRKTNGRSAPTTPSAKSKFSIHK